MERMLEDAHHRISNQDGRGFHRRDFASVTTKQPWHLNKTALKYIRDSHEEPRGTPTVEFVDLFDKDPIQDPDAPQRNGGGLQFCGAISAMVMAVHGQRHDHGVPEQALW